MSKTIRTLYLMSGVPASGKSTYARKLAASNGAAYISRDEIRFAILKDNEDYFSHEDEVFDLFIMNIQEILDSGNDCIADATHLNIKSRLKTLNHLDLSNVRVVLIMMDTPIYECLARNSKRAGLTMVPQSALLNMGKAYKAPMGEELNRYAQILHIRKEDYDV